MKYPSTPKNHRNKFTRKLTQSETIRVNLAVADTLFRQGLASLLNSAFGISVTAETELGRSALSAIHQHCSDIVIMGAHIIDVKVLELARQAVRAEPNVKLLLVGDSKGPKYLADVENAGCAGFVNVRQDFADLELAVRTIAAGSSFVAFGAAKKRTTAIDQSPFPEGLSIQEREVTRLIALGKSGKEIAKKMNISQFTVNSYRERLMRKLEARNVADVTRYAMRIGLVH